MLDRMLISGHAGLLAIPDGDKAVLYRADGACLGKITVNEVGRIFGHSGVLESPPGDLKDGLRKLAAERDMNRALRFFLMLLDPEEDDDLALRAVSRLELLLNDTTILQHLKNEMYSAALPSDVDHARADRMTKESKNLSLFWRELIANQTEIAANRAAFDQANWFLDPEEASLALEKAIEAGTFPRLLDEKNLAVVDVIAAPGFPRGKAEQRLYQQLDVLSQTSKDPEPAPSQFWSRWSSKLAATAKEVETIQPLLRLPDITMRGLLESGAHFGHQSHRWNPKMDSYIFGTRNNIHIIDLAQTVPLIRQALKAVSDTVARGGRVLFVGTKRQAQDSIAEAARRSAQYYVNSRWLGGMLTNWKTISGSIQRLRKVNEMLDVGAIGLTKKERLMLSRERDKLEKALGGIKDMGGTPDLIFVIDIIKEQLAIREAERMHIPVVAILDTNCDPDGIKFPIPGNDDAGRAIKLYCDLIARAAINGLSRNQSMTGVDVDEMEQPMDGVLPTVEGKASETFELLSSPRGTPDDLSKLHGVGPKIIKKLNNAGIYHYWQVAAMTSFDVAKIDHDLKLGGRINLGGWVEAAKDISQPSNPRLALKHED